MANILLAVFFLHAVVSHAFEIHIGSSIITIAVQSQSLTLDQWFSTLTLALAPLVTHIVFGIPETVLLSERRPPLWETLPHYNPVSIFWRYNAIAYRRLRARCWDRADMAASNAVFWDGKRWDGSDSMTVQSRNWVTRLPEKSHVSLLSPSCIATLVILLQAIQASAKLILSLDYQHSAVATRFSTALPYIFFPFAVISVARLLCACWLTSDYGFQKVDPWKVAQDEISLERVQTVDSEPLLKPWIQIRYYSHKSRRARLFQIFWLINSTAPTIPCLVIMASMFGPRLGVVIDSAVGIVSKILYMVIILGITIITPLQIFTKGGGSTLIPCIQAGWYKAFNILCIFLLVLTFILSALQTRILPDGTYSTVPELTNESI